METGLQGTYYSFNPGYIQPLTDTSGFNNEQLQNKFAAEASIYLSAKHDISTKLALHYGLRINQFNRLAQSGLLEYANEQGASTCIISARNKGNMLPNTHKIITNSIYYHTHECLSLMLIYQLIYKYKNKIPEEDLIDCPPPIKIVNTKVDEINCTNCDNGNLDHSFCIESENIRHVPPGLEKDNDNIAIDFDGVIHNFDKGYYDGTCYGDPIHNSLNALKLLSNKYNVIIYSSKCLPDRPLINGLNGKQLIIKWLQKYDVLKYVKEITHFKPRAKYYIDDKGITFKNNWDEILQKLI